ncbi:MAG TPA: RNA methyltransferase [Clostridia bacterium]|nr:MAG: putative TrmH family tRNA/rRNA methyltransferase [Firmicutes bacterium ADurb.Bin146]HOD92536.1 RNA methyltransferase [Clostridia bacterium]HQM39194.1 RNA methyltransferase [Clostridia bacterium]
MNRIESKDNQRIKRLKSLDKKKVREQEDLFFIEGRKLLDEALKSHVKVTEVYVSDTYYQNNMSYVDRLAVKDIFLIKDGILNSLSYLANPEGILALGHPLKWDILEVIKRGSPVLVMDRINDPKNAGAMIRSAEAFGIGCVFALEGCADLYNEKALRASMGSLFRVPYIKVTHEVFAILNKAEYVIYGLDSHGLDIETARLDKHCAIVIGNEANGLDKNIKKHLTEILSIPMKGMTESLNAACAAGIVMYKISRL